MTRKRHSLLANFHLLPSKLTMTNYSSSNTALLPIFEEAEVFLTALAGQDAQFTFQTFDDVKVWSDYLDGLQVDNVISVKFGGVA